MTTPTSMRPDIILDMRETKEQQKKNRNDRWNGYKIDIIKDSEDAMDKLHEALANKHQKREDYLSSWR